MNDAILLIQYMVIQLFLHYSDWVKSLLYGESMIMNSSRQSIVPILVSMLVTCVAGLFLLKENRLKIIYYVQNHSETGSIYWVRNIIAG